MDGSSTPLADYFWIAGVESITYDDTPPGFSQAKDHPVETTIAEDGEPAEEPFDPNGSSSSNSNRVSAVSARHSRQGSGNRFSKITADNRFSVNTVNTLEDLDGGNTASNRSSATIRAVNNNGAASNTNSNANGLTIPEGGPSGIPSGSGLIEGFDFDKALLKFAAERENFLEDLTFSAGAKVSSRPPMVNPRAERIKADEGDLSGRRSPLKSIRGSIQRRISIRDMNSMRKQPNPRASTAGRAGESSLASWHGGDQYLLTT